MFCVPSFDEMTNLTPYFNHVIPAYAGIQTVSHSASQVEEISETGSLVEKYAHRPNHPLDQPGLQRGEVSLGCQMLVPAFKPA